MSLLRGLILALLIPSAALATAQNTSEDAPEVLLRSEELRQARREKAHELREEKSGAIEKAMLFIEEGRLDEIFSIRYKDFYPKFGNVSSGSGMGLGVRYFKKKIADGPLTVETSYIQSFREYRSLDFNLGTFNRLAPAFFVGPPEFGAPFEFGPARPREVDRSRKFLYGDFRYHYFPREVYYGPGNSSVKENRTSYLNENFDTGLQGGYQFTNWLAAGVGLGYRRYNIEPGDDKYWPATQDLFDESSTPGLANQPDFLILSGGVFVNYTDQPGNPHKGGAIGFGYARVEDREGDDYDFHRYSLDVRHYLPLGSEQRVLAVRFYSVLNNTDEDSRVPFYLQPVLGGALLLRGYPEFRFREANMYYLTGEYRWEPAPAFEIALFYDTGKVYSTEQSMEWNGLKKSIGVGFRFKTMRNTIFRLDVGRSDEGTALQFRFGPSF